MNILKECEIKNIYTRYAKDITASSKDYGMHIHDRCELFYFIAGTAHYKVEGTEYPLYEGDLLLMRPGEAHCVKIIKKGIYERYAINFPLNLFDSIDPERRLMIPFMDRELGSMNLYKAPELKNLFEQLTLDEIDEYDRSVLQYSMILQIMMFLRTTYVENTNSIHKHNNSLSTQIIEHVNSHLFEIKSLPELANTFYISTSQLGRIFKQSTGASAWEYITAKRLIYAKDLISQGSTAGNAALQCGFSDYSAFYRAYVKRYGISPKSDRN